MLLNSYAEAMVREAREQIEEGVKVGRPLIHAVRFTDEQAIVSPSEVSLRVIMNKLNRVVELIYCCTACASAPKRPGC